MSFFDFFFPEQAQASHLRRIASRSNFDRKRNRNRHTASRKRLNDLERDVGFLALVVGTLMQQLDEKEVLRRDDVRAALAELDEVDGVKDGKLDLSILRGMTK